MISFIDSSYIITGNNEEDEKNNNHQEDEIESVKIENTDVQEWIETKQNSGERDLDN